jgi:[acyl-carrier-protein] S-malonyltransferase
VGRARGSNWWASRRGALAVEGSGWLLAFTFPGQGSQRPAMGAAWVDHPSWELVEHASEVLDRDVAELLLEADAERLTRTTNAQLATFVASLVVLDATERLGLQPAAAAGHSLGEYTALVATGALSYEDGLRLVAERGEAMQDAADHAPGTMMAVLGLPDDAVEAACVRAEGEVWVANYNAPGQVVIAGTEESLARAAQIARSLGAKRVLRFAVGGAFHTPLMAPARDRLRKALQAVAFREAEPVVVANVDARPHPDPLEWPGLLSAQLCAPVRWRQTLEALHASGARTFVELGPGGVLTGLLRRALPAEDVTGHSVATPDDLEALVEALGAAAERERRAHAVGERYVMTERLVVAPATGPFRLHEALAAAAPKLRSGRHRHRAGAHGGEADDAGPALRLAVGDLVGWAGDVEIRSPFAGSLEGVLVLAGERVVTGQPVAWLRVDDDQDAS